MVQTKPSCLLFSPSHEHVDILGGYILRTLLTVRTGLIAIPWVPNAWRMAEIGDGGRGGDHLGTDVLSSL